MSEQPGGAATVKCGQCDTILEEASDVLPEDRTPCPNCGSTSRRFEVTLDVVIRPPTATATANAPEPGIVTGPSTKSFEALKEALDDLNPDHARTICWTDTVDGTFKAEVLDENGETLAQGIGDNEDDAILNLADYLRRSTPEDDAST